MTEVTKTVNYTEAQTAELVQGYQAGQTVEALAEAFGKSVRSVVAKLSREGVYKPKTKAAGAGRVTKMELIARIAAVAGVEPTALASLEKANHDALELLVAAVVK